uniref:Protein disulfide isomerase-like 1-2 n=1 Tax=Zeugodacus cucurbitae TaxID=28588 RepID=A0A0A1X8G3_ZEUCU
MNIDAEKLLYLIESRSPIYNNKNKEQSNKLITAKLWDEIATEMNCDVAACKNKWINLRNSYSRYLREEKDKPSGLSGKQRRKWYLADAMSFLKKSVHQHHGLNSNSDSPYIKEQTVDMSQNEFKDVLDEETVNSGRSSPIPTKNNRTSLTEMVAEQISEYLHAKTKKKLNENGNALFFKSLLSDYEKLSSRRQRVFRMHMVNKMNELQEEEENDYLSASTPYVVNECK